MATGMYLKTFNPSARTLCAMLTVLLPAMTQAAIFDCDVGGKSVNPNNGHTTAGLTGMMRCVDRDTGTLAREQELQNGKFIGLDRFYEKGNLIREHRLNEQGNKEGIARTLSPSGRLLAEENYRSGSNLGLQKHYFESGALKRLSFYDLSKNSPANMPFIHTENIASLEFSENGRLAGLHCARRPVIRFEKIDDTTLCGFAAESKVDLFDRDTLRARLTLRQGEIIARTTFWPDGRPRAEAGPLDAGFHETTYRQSGQKLKEIIYVQAGNERLRSIERDFHESGQMTSEKRWADGRLNREASWYLNGQQKWVLEYRDNEMTRREFHDNGQRSFEGRFVRERSATRPIGEQLRFDDKGQLRSQYSHDERGRIAREREFDEAGKLIRDDAVFEDGSRKAFAR